MNDAGRRKVKPYSILAVVMVLASLAVPYAYACYEAMSDERMIMKSDLIVVGEITRVRRVGFRKNRKSVATIKIGETLKGDENETVKLAFPVRQRGMMKSTDIFYEKGQEGIWFLRKPEDDDFYYADHPARFQPIEKLDRYKALLGVQKEDEDEGRGNRVHLDPWKKQII